MHSKPEKNGPQTAPGLLNPLDSFSRRHLGSPAAALDALLLPLGLDSLDTLIDATVPPAIRLAGALALPKAIGENAALSELRALAARNTLKKSFIGQGYQACITPPVILRNILENPGWYTAYTPYQAEIAQGRLEALANFQTMILDLTGMDIANASMLDEATAAAEAVGMALAASRLPEQKTVLLDHHCHPQTIAVVTTRAAALGLEVLVSAGQGHFRHSSPGSRHPGFRSRLPIPRGARARGGSPYHRSGRSSGSDPAPTPGHVGR